jgi:hypothetical protein
VEIEMMGRQARSVLLVLIAAAILTSVRWPVGHCQDDVNDDYDGDQRAKTASNPLVANLFYGKIRNMTRSFSRATAQKLDYCINDSSVTYNIYLYIYS